MTSSVKVLKAVLSQSTGPLVPGGCTESPLVWSVTFSPPKNWENSVPMTLRSLPLWGTIRPLRWVFATEIGSRERFEAKRAVVMKIRRLFSSLVSWFTHVQPRFLGRSFGRWLSLVQCQALDRPGREIREKRAEEKPLNIRAGDGILASVSMWIPPAGSSDGSWKLLIVTPGSPLKALNVTTLDKETLSNIVPRAVSRSLGVDIVQSKLGLWSKKVANSVKLLGVSVCIKCINKMQMQKKAYTGVLVIVSLAFTS